MHWQCHGQNGQGRKISNNSLRNVLHWKVWESFSEKNKSVLSPNRVKTGASLTPDVGLLCLGKLSSCEVVDPVAVCTQRSAKTNMLPTTSLRVPEGWRAILYRQASPSVGKVCLDQAHTHRLNVFCREVHGTRQKPTRSQSGVQHLSRELQQ